MRLRYILLILGFVFSMSTMANVYVVSGDDLGQLFLRGKGFESWRLVRPTIQVRVGETCTTWPSGGETCHPMYESSKLRAPDGYSFVEFSLRKKDKRKEVVMKQLKNEYVVIKETINHAKEIEHWVVLFPNKYLWILFEGKNTRIGEIEVHMNDRAVYESVYEGDRKYHYVQSFSGETFGKEFKAVSR